MKYISKIYIIFVIVILLVCNTKVIIQDNRFVIGSRVCDSALVFNNSTLTAIWIGDTLFPRATQEDYENL